jgi:hypothetical protein
MREQKNEDGKVINCESRSPEQFAAVSADFGLKSLTGPATDLNPVCSR